jgi:hypothetical protein
MLELSLTIKDKLYLKQLSVAIKNLSQLHKLSKNQYRPVIENSMKAFYLSYEEYFKQNKKLLQKIEQDDYGILQKAFSKLSRYILDKEVLLINYFDTYGKEYGGYKGCADLSSSYDESAALLGNITAFNVMFGEQVDYLDDTHVKRIMNTMANLIEQHCVYSDGYCDAC